MTQPIVPIRSSTQQLTDIEDIDHDVVLFADGAAAMVLATSAVNFGLLSQKEQEAIIYAYAGLLNSLSFPIQILIRSQRKDVTAYLGLLEERQKQQKNPKLASSIGSYRLFVEATVKEKEVLDKNFYVVLPFSRLELGASTKVLFGTKSQGLPYPKDVIFERVMTVLSPKRDHIIRLLGRLGLRAYQLTSEQLVKLFFSIYNPGQPLPDYEKLRSASAGWRTKS